MRLHGSCPTLRRADILWPIWSGVSRVFEADSLCADSLGARRLRRASRGYELPAAATAFAKSAHFEWRAKLSLLYPVWNSHSGRYTDSPRGRSGARLR